MTVEVTPTGISTLAYKFFIIWTVMNLVFILPCVYFFFPETKGLSLEAIDEIFIRSKSMFEPVWVAKKILKEGRRLGDDEVTEERIKSESSKGQDDVNGTDEKK